MSMPANVFAVLAGCLLLAACATAPRNQTAQTSLPQAPPVKLPALPPAGEPKDLAGNSAETLQSKFGTPNFTRKDGTAQFWRYDGARCKAFFFLYADGGSLAVRHVETQPRGEEMAADESCLKALRHASS